MKCRMQSRVRKRRRVKHGLLPRRLTFDSDDERPDGGAEVRELCDDVARARRADFAHRWNFDVDDATPRPGLWAWEEVPTSSSRRCATHGLPPI